MLFASKKSIPPNNYILSIGHLDYRTDVGGVEKVIGEHSEMFLKRNVSYVYICPFNHDGGQYKLYVDNVYKGTFSVESICGLLKSWNDYIHILACHIHHIMFWKRKDLLFLCASIKTQYTFFLHDYYMICESCNLLKNDLLFCGADLPNKKKCDGCKYFDGYFQRKEWLSKLFKICSEKELRFVSPSDYVKRIWKQAYPMYDTNTVVMEHLTFLGSKKIRDYNHTTIKVAFLGSQYEIKGWKEYVELYKEFSDDTRFEFYHLGLPKKDEYGIINIPVSFQQGMKNAMVAAIEENEIDIAIIYTKCPETYNFTCYEAYMGGAFIITGLESGNVTDMVKKYHCGYVVENKQCLIDVFGNCDLKTMISSYKNSSYSVVPQSSFSNTAIANNLSLLEYGSINTKKKKVVTQSSMGLVFDTKKMIKKILRISK